MVIYPVKGMGGVSVSTAEVLERGMKWDRHWMLIDGNGKFLSQRESPEMSLMKSVSGTHGLQVFFGKSSIEIPYVFQCDERTVADIWGTKVSCRLVGKEWDDYFSHLLSREVRLVCPDESTPRIKKILIPPYETSLSFADGYPFLVLGAGSVALLNTKLEQPVPHNRFRANFIINTEIPHEEDSWKRFRIGEVHFQMIKPCVRCNVITIDQATAVLSKEPLKTLSGYRKERNGVIFGMNAIALTCGNISRDDYLEVLE